MERIANFNRGRSSVGRALRSQCRGREFEPHRLQKIKPSRNAWRLFLGGYDGENERSEHKALALGSTSAQHLPAGRDERTRARAIRTSSTAGIKPPAFTQRMEAFFGGDDGENERSEHKALALGSTSAQHLPAGRDERKRARAIRTSSTARIKIPTERIAVFLCPMMQCKIISSNQTGMELSLF